MTYSIIINENKYCENILFISVKYKSFLMHSFKELFEQNLLKLFSFIKRAPLLHQS